MSSGGKLWCQKGGRNQLTVGDLLRLTHRKRFWPVSVIYRIHGFAQSANTVDFGLFRLLILSLFSEGHARRIQNTSKTKTSQLVRRKKEIKKTPFAVNPFVFEAKALNVPTPSSMKSLKDGVPWHCTSLWLQMGQIPGHMSECNCCHVRFDHPPHKAL